MLDIGPFRITQVATTLERRAVNTSPRLGGASRNSALVAMLVVRVEPGGRKGMQMAGQWKLELQSAGTTQSEFDFLKPQGFLF